MIKNIEELFRERWSLKVVSLPLALYSLLGVFGVFFVFLTLSVPHSIRMFIDLTTISSFAVEFYIALIFAMFAVRVIDMMVTYRVNLYLVRLQWRRRLYGRERVRHSFKIFRLLEIYRFYLKIVVGLILFGILYLGIWRALLMVALLLALALYPLMIIGASIFKRDSSKLFSSDKNYRRVFVGSVAQIP